MGATPTIGVWKDLTNSNNHKKRRHKMPNIHIVGFSKKKAHTIRERINKVLQEIGEDHDACTTIISAEVRWCSPGKKGSAPYLQVCNTNLDRCAKIAMALNKKLNLDVEFSWLDGFLGAKPKRKKKA